MDSYQIWYRDALTDVIKYTIFVVDRFRGIDFVGGG